METRIHHKMDFLEVTPRVNRILLAIIPLTINGVTSYPFEIIGNKATWTKKDGYKTIIIKLEKVDSPTVEEIKAAKPKT